MVSDQENTPEEQPSESKPVEDQLPATPEPGRIPNPDLEQERLTFRKGEDPSRPMTATDSED